MRITCTAQIRPYCFFGTGKCCLACPLNQKCREENKKKGCKLIPCGDEHAESLKECGFCSIEK